MQLQSNFINFILLSTPLIHHVIPGSAEDTSVSHSSFLCNRLAQQTRKYNITYSNDITILDPILWQHWFYPSCYSNCNVSIGDTAGHLQILHIMGSHNSTIILCRTFIYETNMHIRLSTNTAYTPFFWRSTFLI